VALQSPDTVRSPDWWLLRLGRRLRDREHKHLCRYRDYYRGEHPLPQGLRSSMTREEIRAWHEFQRKSRTNFCKLVVKATVNRQQAIGITTADGKADDEAWTWWQQNRLDSRQKQLYRLVGATGYGYMMVGPHPRDPSRPLMTVEHPREVITEADPETGDVAAALKAWWDSVAEVGRATLYLGDQIYRYTTPAWSRHRPLPWGPDNWTITGDPQTNRLGEPGVVPFEFDPEEGEEPEPDFWPLRDLQDRLNLSVLNRMTIERYAASPQAYATGMKVKKAVDPLTGLEVPQNPLRRGPDGVWINENPDGKFGHIPPADLISILKVHEHDIRTMFVLTSTPAYYMPGDLVNVSTDTVVALETNHVAKIHELNTNYGESLEHAFALAAKVAGVDRDFDGHEIRWKDPRQLNPAVIADMAVKKKSIGWPLTMVAEDMGESPQRVERLQTESAAEKLLAFGQQQQPQADQQTANGQVPTGPLQVQIPDTLQGLV
jgi:hypothetical protein